MIFYHSLTFLLATIIAARGFQLHSISSKIVSNTRHCSAACSKSELAVATNYDNSNDANDTICNGSISRRSAASTALSGAFAAAAFVFSNPIEASAKPAPNGLKLQTAPSSGLRWADAKLGTGEIPESGSVVNIDYSMASTAGRFPSIYSTKNGDETYRWKLGDGTTIAGIDLAILGSSQEGIPPMRPGGIRRVIIPNSLGYNSLINRDKDNNVLLNNNANELSPSAKNQRCLAGAEDSLGPIPPKDAPDGAYQRWYQFYCNPRIPYQPDLVMDIKLYGKRGTSTASAASVVAQPPQ